MTAVYGIGAHLRYLLTQSSALTALVGSRIFPEQVPQRSAFPALVYSQVTSERVSVMGGDTGTVRSTWQVDAYATTYAVARQVASEARQAIQRHRGITPGSNTPVSNRLIQDIFVMGDTDLFDDEAQMYQVSVDYMIWYDEQGE